jgi:uncharacterized protein
MSFYCAPVHSWGNDAHDSALAFDEYATREIEWLNKAATLGFAVQLIPQRKEITCLAVRKSGDLVAATGELFNCTEVSYVPSYGNPNARAIGTLESGEVLGRRNLLADFNDRVEAHEFPCAECYLLPACGGSCPKLWQEGLIPCPSTKNNIGQRLLLLTKQQASGADAGAALE